LEKQELPIFHKKRIRIPPKKLTLFKDRIFTTFRTYNGRVPFLKDHLDRLEQGCSYFYPSEDFNALKSKILTGLKQLISMHHSDLRYRITLYVEAEELDFFVSTYHLSPALFECDLIRGRMPRYPSSVPGNIKWGNNYREIFYELKWAQKQGHQEVLFFTKEGFITECSTSNIFLIKKDKVLTPRFNKAFVTGVIRNNLIKYIDVDEIDLTFNDLKESDVVFLTNSVRGIVPVTSFEGKSYEKPSKILNIYQKMIEENCE